MGGKKRKQALARGKSAEWRAAMWLMLKGYRILERNWRCPYGEIDILAKKGGCLVVVEVKNRKNAALLPLSVLEKQRQRLERAGLYYQQLHPRSATMGIRFDAILAERFFLRHVPFAWWAGR